MNTEVKKTRPCSFININGQLEKETIDKYVDHPTDATSYILWENKDDETDWGLTIKSVPDKRSEKGFISQHTWKMTWYNDKENGVLQIANHCKSLGEPITGEGFTAICNLMESQKKLKKR